jgi:hypothetical protein
VKDKKKGDKVRQGGQRKATQGKTRNDRTGQDRGDKILGEKVRQVATRLEEKRYGKARRCQTRDGDDTRRKGTD